MADENTIMEMMEEMEAYFDERNRLYREREEAFLQRYKDLVNREDSVKEKEKVLEKSRADHMTRLVQFNDIKEEIL